MASTRDPKSAISKEALLVEDTWGEKGGSWIPDMRKKKEHFVMKGTLLSALPDKNVAQRSDGKPAHNYHTYANDDITLYCPEEDVCPLTHYELQLLSGMKTAAARYEAFIDEILEWGTRLKINDVVNVKLPSDQAIPGHTRCQAEVKWIGVLPGDAGIKFGLEIMGHQLFVCPDDAGMFESLDKLAPTANYTPYQLGKQASKSPQGAHAELRFKINDRVAVYDMKNNVKFGVVRWIGTDAGTRILESKYIGIETDEVVVTKSFPRALTGTTHLFSVKPAHRLVVPEHFVFREELATPDETIDLREQQRIMAEIEREKAKQDREKEKAGYGRGRQVQKQSSDPIPGSPGQQDYSDYQDNRGDHGKAHQLQRDYPHNSNPAPDSHKQPTPMTGDRPYTSYSYSFSYVPPEYQMQSAQQYKASNVRSSNPYNLGVGSSVQITSTDPNQPLHYGLIRWIGFVALVDGQVAGIELDEYMDGCTDGTFKGTGEKFFSCAFGHGLYFPLGSLFPDKRLRPATRSNSGQPGSLHGSDIDQPEVHQLKKENTSLLTEKESLQQRLEALEVEKRQMSQQAEQLETEKHNLQSQLNVQTQEHRKQLSEQTEQFEAEKRGLQEQAHTFRQQLAQKEEQMQQLNQQHEQQIQALQKRLDQLQAKESKFTQVQIPKQGQDSWNVHRREVVIQGELGRGAWGSVSKGMFRGKGVAVKRAHHQILEQITIDQLKREIRIMAHVQHPNLVRMIAAVVDQGVEREMESPLLVMELLDINLRSAYKRYDLGTNRLPIFRDVAYALHYLHEHQEPIIHRDVSAPNVLLQEIHRGVWKAKLSDFGSANLAKQCKTAAPGAIVYSAPETFPPRNPYDPLPKQTTKIDVFSYGYLLAEVITKQMPSNEKRVEMFTRIKRDWEYMYSLIETCVQWEPEDRPTMTQVLEKLSMISR